MDIHTELNANMKICKIQVTVMNHNKTNITASGVGGVSDPNCDATKVYTDTCQIFLGIRSIMNIGKGKPVPPPDRQFTITTFKGQKFQATP